MTIPRFAAPAALAITVLGVVYAVTGALASWEPSFGWLLQAILHVGELLAVVALAAVATGRPARAALGVAVLGQLVLAVAEVVYPAANDLGDALFGIGPILSGLGLIVAGVALLRERRRLGWLPLAIGVYTFVVLTPVLIGSGGPPAPAALLAIAGWDVLWAALAASLLPRRATAAAGPRRVEAELR